VDTTCEEFENGSALHIAATNLSVEAAKSLLGFGADVQLTDDLVRVDGLQ
jgi:CAP-Gly domain-containing linker protein 3/4